MDIKNIAGEYYLQGQREMASGFLISADNTFKFFFSYGALDRYGSGNWFLNADRLTLSSSARRKDDFILVDSGKKSKANITVRLDKANAMLFRHVYCSLENGREGTWAPMSDEGEINFPAQEIGNICLLLEFCAERFSKIPVNKDHSDFTFRMEPSIMEVFFNDFTLQVSEASLSGPHPLMEGSEFQYAGE